MAFTTYDNAPYLYRRSGGGGDKEIDKLVGGTIAWNQLIKNGNFADTSNWITWGSTITVSGNVATVSTPGQWNQLSQVFDWTYGHVMLAISSVKKFGEDGGVYVKVVNNFGYVNQQFTRVIPTNDVWTDVIFCGKYTKTPTDSVEQVRWGIQEYRAPNASNGFQVKNVMVCDLTLMFGSTIADYVYSLEQSSTGSGLAWLRSYGFFTEDYYDYNSGELKSVSNLVSHDMTGKNLNPWQGVNYSASVSRTIWLNEGTYILSTDNGNYLGGNNAIYFAHYDANGNNITDGAISSTQLTLNGGKTFYYGSLRSSYVFTILKEGLYSFGFNNEVPSNVGALQLELGSTATSYEPYTLHSYPLGDVTLRGLPKLNGNALYYDGDTYESNGTVTRKYGVADLGTLNWWYDSNSRFVTNSLSSVIKNPVDRDTAVNAICVKYTSVSNNSLSGADKALALDVGYIYVKDSSYSDAASFKTAMSGVYLVYELASSTTETADTYTNPQWVDPNGTERYTLSSNAFPMPVGHETTYNTDMGNKTVNTQVNLSMTEPSVRQIYAKEGDTARVLNIHLDQTEEDGTLRILRPDGTEVTADAVLVPEFYDGLMAEIPSDATSVVGKCYCDVEQNGVSSMPFTLNVKKNERQ